MGQVWSKANFDGINEVGFLGGRGSALAVTSQNPGADGEFGTEDDVHARLNIEPAAVSFDASTNDSCENSLDRVRGFYSFHTGGGYFLFADGSVHFLKETIDEPVYRGLSTIRGEEAVGSSY